MISNEATIIISKLKAENAGLARANAKLAKLVGATVELLAERDNLNAANVQLVRDNAELMKTNAAHVGRIEELEGYIDVNNDAYEKLIKRNQELEAKITELENELKAVHDEASGQ